MPSVSLSSLTASELALCKDLATKSVAIAGPRRTVRAEVLAAVLSGTGAIGARYQPKTTAKLSGFEFVGDLELSNCSIGTAVVFRECRFDAISGAYTKLRGLEFDRSVLTQGISMPGATFDGSLRFIRSVVDLGVHLAGARIASQLVMQKLLVRSEGVAFATQGSQIEGGILARDTRLFGTWNSIGSHVDSDVVLINLRVIGKREWSIAFDRSTIFGGVLVQDSRLNNEGLRIAESTISGGLDLRGSTLELNAAYARIAGLVDVRRSNLVGRLDLTRSTIGGLIFRGNAALGASDQGVSLVLDSALVQGDVDFLSGTTAEGRIYLIDATIEGQLDFDGLRITATDLRGSVINANHARVRHAVFLSETAASGHVELLDLSTRTIALNSNPTFAIGLHGAEFSRVIDSTGRLMTADEALSVFAKAEIDAGSYHVLARSFAERADFTSARQVRIRHQDVVRRDDPIWKQPWNWLLRTSVRYGEQLWRALPLWAIASAVATYFIAATWSSSWFPDLLAQPPIGFGFEANSTTAAPFNAVFMAMSLIVPGALGDLAQWHASEDSTVYLSIGIRAVGWVLATCVITGFINWLRRT
jgi:hypothetical protein